jgi:UDP-glucose 4-epimerase
MTVLVTGASGLIGERLVPRLIAAGHTCRVLLRAGKAAPAGAECVQGDLFDPAALERATSNVDAILHLAALFRSNDEELIWRTNLEGTRNLIGAAARVAPGARFIFASTSNVYPPDGVSPAGEEDRVAPSHAYPASKVAAETEVRESGMTWTVLRLPFVYGDGDGHVEALPRHLAHFAHPANRMSMLHHRDLATAVGLALAGRFDGRVVNLADDAPTTVHELVRLVGGTMPGSSDPMKNPWHLHVDASLARQLGFRPAIRSVHQAFEEAAL